MKKRMGLLGLLIALQAYATDDFFYEEKSENEVGSVRLEESVIATTGFETSIRNTAANVTIVTSKEIEEKGYTTVEEALQAVPSVKITQSGFGSVIDVRGQGKKKAKSNVKILIDGVAIVPLNKTHATMSLDSINLDNIESIEVIPGGGAVLYGTGTVGGVVNIRTKSGSGMVPVNSVKMEGGSHGRTRVSSSAGALIEEDLLIQTNILSEQGNSHLDGYKDENLGGDILAKYRISDSQDISLKYEKSRRDKEDTGALLTKEEYESDKNQKGAASQENKENITERDALSLTYNNQLNERAKFSVITSYQLLDQHLDSDYGDSTKNLVNDIREEQIDIKPKLQLKYGKDNTLIFGYDYSYQNSVRQINGYRRNSDKVTYKPQQKRDKRYSESHSVYALNAYKINKLELTQGIRFNRTENTTKTINYVTPSESTAKISDEMNNMAYELAANYLYSDTGNGYIRWERGFNTPDPSAIFNNPSDEQINEGYEYGLSDVNEETYDSFEVGLRDFVLGSYVSLTLFYTKTADEIYKDGNSSNWIAYNLDETERRGAELSLEQYFGKLTLTEGYTYIDAEITGGKLKGNKVAGVSKHNMYLSGKYAFNQKVDTIVSVRYESDMYADNDNSKADKDNGRTVTDVIVNYKVKENIRLYVGINNLFSEKYADRYEIESGLEKYRAADERNYYAGINYTF